WSVTGVQTCALPIWPSSERVRGCEGIGVQALTVAIDATTRLAILRNHVRDRIGRAIVGNTSAAINDREGQARAPEEILRQNPAAQGLVGKAVAELVRHHPHVGAVKAVADIVIRVAVIVAGQTVGVDLIL